MCLNGDPDIVVSSKREHMGCAECKNLALEYERLIRAHGDYLNEYQAAVAVGDVGKMWEFRFAASGARILAIRARDRLAAHQATHSDATAASAS